MKLEGQPVQVRAWEYEVKGIGGFVVPVQLLDCDLPEIPEWDRKLTHYLYSGHAIALNGSFFNTQRMVLQYVLNAYFE